MIDETLQEQAALYAAGALPAIERQSFEQILAHHPELGALVAEFEEITAAAAGVRSPTDAPLPSPAVRARLLAEIENRPQTASENGFVMTNAEGLVQFINPAFTALCGYTLEEVRGKKLGPLLQGPQTDPATADRMRRAVHEHRACVETILNYHKSGQSYWVEIALTPIPDEAGTTRWFVATEREVADHEMAA